MLEIRDRNEGSAAFFLTKLEQVLVPILVFLLVAVPFFHLPSWYDTNQHSRLIMILVGTTVLTLSWLLSLHGRSDGAVHFDRLDVALLLFWALLGFSLISARSLTGAVLSDASLESFLRWTSGILIALLLPRWVRTVEHVRLLILAACISGTAIALLGLAQEFSADVGALSYFRRNALSGPPQGPFGNRNFSAPVVAGLLPCALFFAFEAKRLKSSKGIKNLVFASACTSFGLMGLYLRFSVTRSSWLGASLGLGVLICGYLLVTSKRKVAITRLLVLGAMLVALVGVSYFLLGDFFTLSVAPKTGDFKRNMSVLSLISSFFDFDGHHWQSRLAMWRVSIEILKDHPWGAGLGSWGLLFPKYAAKVAGGVLSINESPFDAHNDFFQLLAETGVAGLIAFLAILSGAVISAFRVVRGGGGIPASTAVLAGLICLSGSIAILGDGLLSFPMQLPTTVFFFFLLIGLVRTVARVDSSDGASALQPRLQVRLPLGVHRLVVIATAFCSGCIWIYCYGVAVMTPALALAASAHRMGEFQVCLDIIYGHGGCERQPSRCYAMLARCHGGRKELPAQERALAKALQFSPHNLELQSSRLRLLSVQERWREHRVQLDETLILRPDWLEGLCLFADSRLGSDREIEIISKLEPYLNKYGGSPCFALSLGRSYRQLGKWEQAALVWTQLAGSESMSTGGLDPSVRARLWFDIAYAWEQAEKHDESRAGWIKAFSLSPEPPLAMRLEFFRAMVRMGFFGDAIRTAIWLDTHAPREFGHIKKDTRSLGARFLNSAEWRAFLRRAAPRTGE